MTIKTIGALADQMHDLREQKRALEEEIKVIEDKYNILAMDLFDLADEQGTTTGKGKRGSFSLSEAVVPQVKDWDAYWKYITKNKYYHLVERRPSVTGCRELFDKGVAIPGVEKFTKRTINLRKV